MTEQRDPAAPADASSPSAETDGAARTGGSGPVTEEAQAGAERAEIAVLKDRLLRAAAELDNVRKRAQREAEEGRRRALEGLFTDLLAVKDSLELGLAACRGEAGPVVEGLGMTLRLLDQLFARYGVETIDPQHAAFDPRYHEAMATQPDGEHAPGTVLLVVQKGYGLHGRLLRPARVVVAAPPLDSPRSDPT